MGLVVKDVDARPPAQLVGGLKVRIAQVTFDSSYPTGGESLTDTDLGLTAVVLCIAHPASGYSFEYDYTNEKLLAYYGNYDAADGPFIEVPNTTDLSAIITRVLAIGT